MAPHQTGGVPPDRPTVVTDSEVRRQLEQWLDDWSRVGPALDAERTAELRAMTDAEAARIAVEIVWPMGALGEHRGGDDGEGLEVIGRLQRELAVRG
jgi:hypothetical protein